MRGRVRVLHVIPHLAMGGAEKSLVNLLKAFDDSRFEVAVVSLYPEGERLLEQELKEDGIQVYFLNKHQGLDLGMVLALHRLFHSFKPDVVHTHLSSLRYTLLPMLLCCVPVRIHTVHTVARNETDWIGKPIRWIAFRFFDVVPVSICRNVAKTIRAIYGRRLRTPVIPIGIPTGQFACTGRHWGGDEEPDVVLVHIGRFSPEKSHLLLIESFAMAVKQYDTMHLWLVGDGELRPVVEDQVSKRGLQEKVSFLGIRANVAKLYAEGHLLILPSNWEGSPQVIMEAMAAGLPVIATAVGGVPEMVEDGITGILVPPRDSESLTQAILQLATAPKLREKMGDAAIERAKERFDIGNTVARYERLYLSLLQSYRR